MFAKMDQDLKENSQTDENLYKKNNSGGETKNEDNSKGYDELSSLIKDIQLNNLIIMILKQIYLKKELKN